MGRRLRSVAPGGRIELVDALRALALAGILQVNIQSFVWGSGDPLGAFLTIPSASDIATHVLVGTFIAGKFVSMFAFLFGFGAALQFRSIRRALPDTLAGLDRVHATQAVYARRLRFLVAVGIVHGVLFYYGDILTFYALCGFILVLLLPRRAAKLVRAARVAWTIAAVLMIALTVLLETGRPDLDAGGATVPLPTMRAFMSYTEGGFFDMIGQRVSDYLTVQLGSVMVSTPQIVGLFLLGVLAGRLGWLARPDRHRTLWQVATWLGLAALPVAAYGAWLNYEAARAHPGEPSGIGYLLQFFGTALACCYVAALVRLREFAPVAALVRWIAPAGRMPLSNYLAQSVAMGVLLSGWGFGLGAVLNRTELALVAIAIVVAQWVVSRWWIGHFGQGPMEAWWARTTYRTLARPAPSGSAPPPQPPASRG